MSDTYSNVDAARDVAEAVAWQDSVDAWPQIAAYKRRTHELLPDSGLILDVGSGTGHDLFASDRDTIGVDASMAMCTTARGRGADVVRAAADALPFGARVFAGARADRLFQHLADPDAALREMVRIVEAGGRIVVADPDQGSLVIHLPGVRSDLVDRIRRRRRDVGYRNGMLARALPERFTAAGLQGVTVEAFPLVLTDVDDAFGLPTWVEYWRQHFTDEDAAEWAAGVDRARSHGQFVYALLYFVVAGTKK